MSSAPATTAPPHPLPIRSWFDPLAALLSYLVPGLGQIYQGRIVKGVLFFVCLYGLFFTGMWLGQWQNVYLPDVTKQQPAEVKGPTIITNVWNRLQFAGQFWIGVAAWPAVMQYNGWNVPINKDFQKEPDATALNNLQRDGDKTWDLGWVYTVIAGVLNILVIYDALAGPAFGLAHAASSAAPQPEPRKEAAA